jgi:hypothetical protein
MPAKPRLAAPDLATPHRDRLAMPSLAMPWRAMILAE